MRTRISPRSLRPRVRLLAGIVAGLVLVGLGVASVAEANGPATDTPAVPAAGAPETAKAGEAASCAIDAARRVQSHYESVRDLEARFAQTIESVALGTGSAAATGVTHGTVLLAKPGRMRWHYEQPQESLVVTDGSTLWIYDPAAREAQRLPVTQGYLTGAALQFLIGEGDLLAEFEVDVRDCTADPIQLDLVPRKESSYEKLRLLADRSTGNVRETAIVDLFGNVTTVVFTAVRTNTDPGPELFDFDPPADTRVVDLVVP